MGTMIVFLAWFVACVIIDRILEAKKRKRIFKRQALKKRVYNYKKISTPEFQMKKSA